MHFRFVIQARLGSERLPAKVIAPILKQPLLQHIFNRVNSINGTDLSLVVATARESNESLTTFLRAAGVDFFLGDKSDVLSRYIEAANLLDANDYVVRLTGDNPFIDVVSWPPLKKLLKKEKPDLAYLKGVPLGMGYEAIKVSALRRQLESSLNKSHLEHVTLFLKENKDQFSFAFLEPLPEDITWQVRLTVDTSDDLAMVRKVAEHFSNSIYFGSKEIYQLYKQQPAFFSLNSHINQKRP